MMLQVLDGMDPITFLDLMPKLAYNNVIASKINDFQDKNATKHPDHLFKGHFVGSRNEVSKVKPPSTPLVSTPFVTKGIPKVDDVIIAEDHYDSDSNKHSSNNFESGGHNINFSKHAII